MKKFMSILIVFVFLVGCSKSEEDKIKGYVKQDLVIENGSKININTIFDLNKSNDITKLIKTGKVTIDYKENKISDEITDDKIIGTNDVTFTYSKNNEEKDINIETKIKDTIKPSADIKNTFVTIKQKQEISEKDLIKKLGISVKDASGYSIKIENYNDIDFKKLTTYSLNVRVSDTAKNSIEFHPSLKIVKPFKVYNFPVNVDKMHGKFNKTLTISVPYEIYSQYKITTGTSSSHKSLNSYVKYIEFRNSSRIARINIFASTATGFYGYKSINKYSLNNLSIEEEKFIDDGTYSAMIRTIPTKSLFMSISTNISNYKEFQYFIREIASNITIY